jgi:hypothetical protein
MAAYEKPRMSTKMGSQAYLVLLKLLNPAYALGS